VAAEGSYSVEIFDANGCFGSDDVMVYIIPELTGMDLVESTDMSTWSAISGDLTSGYIMALDPTVTYFYIDAASYSSSTALAAGMYGFYLNTYPTDWFTYWAGKGVDGTPTGSWEDQMWLIINGNAPIFYLKIDAVGVASIVDGLQFDFAGIETYLRVNGDYLTGMYTYTGAVTSSTGINSDPITVNWEFSGTSAAIQAAIDGTYLIAPALVEVMNGNDAIFDASVDFPTFSPSLPQDLMVDLLIELPSPLTAGSVVSIDYNSLPLGSYNVLGTETSLWLSQAMGIARIPLYLAVDATWTITISGLEPGMYDFDFTSIAATALNFDDPTNRYELADAFTVIDVYTVAPDITNMTPADSSLLDGWVMLTVTTVDPDDEVTHLEVDVTKVGVTGSGASGQWMQFNLPTDPVDIATFNADLVGIAELTYNLGVFSLNINTQAVANPFIGFPGWGDGEYIFWYIAHDEFGNQSGYWGDPLNPVDNITYFIETLYDSQTLSISAGYSIISTFIDPAYPNVEDVFAPLGNEVQLIKDENGNPYWPYFGLNNVGNMDIGEGYQIKMSTAQTLEIEGTQVVPEITAVDLPAGWSLFGYLRTSAMDVAVAMSAIASDVNVVKTGSGLVYWPAFGYNSIGDFMPGIGYKARMFASTNLYYPANTTATTKSGIVNPVNKVYTNILNTGCDMTLGIPVNVWETTPAIGDEIAIYSESGMLTGAGVYTGNNLAITIWGNDSETTNVDGMVEGSAYTIKVMRVAEGVEETFEVTSWTEGNGLYADNAIAVVGKLTIAEAAPLTQIFQNVPNPVATSTEIRFFLANESEVNISVYNMLGEKLEVLVSGTMLEGEHTIIFNAENYAVGTYMYTIETPNFTKSIQMTVVR
ncbi:MAG: T9SS type A sorting domain-containing protein, partial [Bacteroidota bacterium]|nr:T9SS type A sorting domain-containing protein [Bacteroidota bacterium]